MKQHAAWKAIVFPNLGPDNPSREATITEPYYENEPLSELGYSFASQIWNGNNYSMMRQTYNRGGPGLPLLGIFKNSFFTSRNARYSTGRGAPALNTPITDGGLDPFFTYDYWAVPTSWYGGLFDEALWDVQVRSFGKDAIKMGPLMFGTKTIEGGNGVRRIAARPDGSVVEMESFEDSAISIALSEAERLASETEVCRRERAATIQETMNRQPSPTPTPAPKNSESEQEDYEDSEEEKEEDDDEDDETTMKVPEDPVIPATDCPRYGEIRTYLLANRAPLELALDTMGILPVSTFYRYIRDHGGFDISAHELRSFLHMASNRHELFL